MLRQLPLFPGPGEHTLTRSSTLNEAIPPFLDHLRADGRSTHTIKAFSSDLNLLAEFSGEATPLKTFTTSRLNTFMEWIEHGRGVPCSRKSYARRVTTLKVFFKFLASEKVIRNNPAAALLQRSGAAPLQSILTDEEVHQLLAYTRSLRFGHKPDARPALLAGLLLDTGIKKGECMALALDHIRRDNPAEPIVIIRHRKPNNVYKERNIPLDPELLPVLEEYLEQYKPKEALFQCTARNLEYVLTDAARGAGIDSTVSFEILRWTSAVRAYQRGVEMEQLREKMGLSRISWRETSDKIVRLAVLQRDTQS